MSLNLKREGNNDDLLKYIEKNGLCLSVTRKWGDRTLAKNSSAWRKLRIQVLERDNYACRFCGTKSKKWQIVDHINGDASNNELNNLGINCILCDAVRHCGHAGLRQWLSLYKSSLSQVEIIKATYKFFEKHNKYPDPEELDKDAEQIAPYTNIFAAKLLYESPYDIEDFHLYKGFFVNPALHSRVKEVLENQLVC